MTMKKRRLGMLLGAALLALGTSPARAAAVSGPNGTASVPPGGSAAPPGTPTPPTRKGRDRAASTPAPVPAAAASPGTAAAANGGQVIGEKEFNSCKKYPSGKRIVKLNLKPDTELGDLISWISSITCKQFLLDTVAPTKSVTMWLSGYYHGKHGGTVVDFAALPREADKVEDYCRMNLDTPVMEAVEKALSVSK